MVILFDKNKQQSRFVAIMQDWGRTQELIAEAQNSSGASAAQYAVYANSMEAALTNLKTSWQELTQAVAKSKTITSFIKFITKALESFSSLLEKGPTLTQAFVIGLMGISAAMNVIAKVKKELGMETDREKIANAKILEQKEAQKKLELEIAKIKAEQNLEDANQKLKDAEEKLKTAQQKLKELDEPGQRLKEEIEKDKDYKGLKEKAKKTVKDYMDSGEYDSEEKAKEALEKAKKDLEEYDDLLKEIVLEEFTAAGESTELVKKSIEEAKKVIEEVENAKEEVKETKEVKGRAETTKDSTDSAVTNFEDSDAAKQRAEAYNELNKAQYQRLERQKTEIALQKQLLEVEKQKVLKAIESAETQEEKNKLLEKQKKLDVQIEKEKEKIEKIETKQNLLSKTQASIVQNITTTLSTQLSTTLNSIFSHLGVFGQLLSRISTSVLDILGTQLLQERAKRKEKEQQVALEATATVNKTVNTGIDAVDKKIQEDITEEEKEQVITNTANIPLNTTNIGQKGTELALEKANTKEVKKGIGAKITSAIVTAAQSAAKIPTTGWVIALTLLAAAGAGVGIAHLAKVNSQEYKDSQSEQQIAESQNTIYQTKKKNSEMNSTISEMENLRSKKYLSNDEKTQLSDLADSLRDTKDAWNNLSDDQVLLEAKKEVAMNNDIIARNTESNYRTALMMSDLSSSVAQQAIAAKLQKDQEKIINAKGLDEEVSVAASEMAEAVASVLSEQDLGGGFSQGYRLDKALSVVNKEILDFAEDMAEADDDVYKQLMAYENMLETADELTIKAAESQYKGIAYLNKAITSNGNLNQETYEKTASALDNLYKSGLLASDSLLSLVESVGDLKDDNKEEINKAIAVYSGNEKLTGTDNKGTTTKEVNLKEIAKELGLGENATANEIKEAYLKKYAKYNEDGSLKYDSKGNIAMYNKGLTNAKRTADYNAIVEFTASIGDYADYTQSQLEVLKNSGLFEFDVEGAVSKLILSINDELKLSGKTEEELAAFSTDLDKQREAGYTITQKGLEMIENLTAQGKETVANYTKRVEELTAQRDSYAEGSAEYEEANDKLIQTQNDLDLAEQKLAETTADLEDAVAKAAGRLSDAEGDELITRTESNKENIRDVKSKVLNGETFTAEDYSFIRDTLASQLTDDYSYEDFLKDLQGGGSTSRAIDFLNYAYANQNEINAADLSASIGSIQAEIDDLLAKEDRTDEEEEELKAYQRTKATQTAQREQLLSIKEQVGYTEEELRLENAKNKLLAEQNSENANSVSSLKEQIKLTEILNQTLENSVNSAYEDFAQKMEGATLVDGSKLSGITADILKDHVKMVNGAWIIDEKWYNALDEGGKQVVEDFKDQNEDKLNDYNDYTKSLKDLNAELIDAEIENQNTLIEAYKNQLQAEQDALQESLDKRKDMYDKYFDALDEEDEDTDFEEEQKRLQNAIAKLSGATDATSQAKLKEYQEELADLEKEQRQTERDRRRDAVSDLLDNQSEMADQYYEELLENEQELWNRVQGMSDTALMNMLESYTDGFAGATELTKTTMKAGFAETIRDVMTMLGNTEAASRATDYLDRYNEWLESGATEPFDYDKYASGGLVDYTGFAWVDGTASRPEAFLNADQTAIFANLASVLSGMYSRSSYSSTNDNEPSTVTIENFTVAVDATLTDNNVQQTGESLADALMEGLRRTGISVNVKR